MRLRFQRFLFQIKWLFNDSLLSSNFQNPRTAENRKIFGAENFFSEKSERIIVVEDLDKGNEPTWTYIGERIHLGSDLCTYGKHWREAYMIRYSQWYILGHTSGDPKEGTCKRRHRCMIWGDLTAERSVTSQRYHTFGRMVASNTRGPELQSNFNYLGCNYNEPNAPIKQPSFKIWFRI